MTIVLRNPIIKCSMWRKIRQQDYNEAIKLYKSGLSLRDIGDFYGVSRQRIHQIFKICGVKFRPPGLQYMKTEAKNTRHIFGKAIRKGLVEKKLRCELCKKVPVNKNGKSGIHAHHEDYNKPLDVIWLCPTCHQVWHKNNVATPCRGFHVTNSGYDLDLTGKKFGEWTVLSKDKRFIGVSGGTRWQCKCDCGAERSVRSYYLRTGRSKSCGCRGHVNNT